MRFDQQPASDNVEDRRGSSSARWRGGSALGGMRIPIGRGGFGIGGLLLLLAIGWMLGINPLEMLGGGPSQGSDAAAERRDGPVRTTPAEQHFEHFVSQVLATTEECWTNLFVDHFGQGYEPPHLVLFRDGVSSACGIQGSAVGPFYCPGDQRIYVDLSFLDEMAGTLGAAGDFAQAYVIAHEVGHHVQNLLGTQARIATGRAGGAEQNRMSVRLELQADYYAGIWAHYVANRMAHRVALEVGDYEEAIRAARAVGDDVLQRRATGTVMPEKFTHGSAAQRAKWFRLGYESGDPRAHDPFVEER